MTEIQCGRAGGASTRPTPASLAPLYKGKCQRFMDLFENQFLGFPVVAETPTAPVQGTWVDSWSEN